MKKLTAAYTAAVIFGLLLLSNLLPVSAAGSAVSWNKVNLPVEGKPGNWVLAKGANIQHLTRAKDGTLYCYANPAGTVYTLFKSGDSGLSWSYTGNVQGVITDISVSPDNASIIYYTDGTNVYKSIDAGASFTPLPLRPGGAGGNNIVITTMEIYPENGATLVAVGTRDSDAAQFGGVSLFDESKPSEGWQDTGLAGYDVYKLAFTPRQVAGIWHLIALANNEAVTRVITKTGVEGGWGAIFSNAPIPVATIVSGDMAFPDNYGVTQSDFTVFIGLNSGINAGDAYVVYNSVFPNPATVIDLNIGQAYALNSIDVTSIALAGETGSLGLLAGAAASAQVYYSSDGGATWKRNDKPPTGTGKTYVLPAPDFTRTGNAFAATSGTEAAFSVSTDAGLNWNQRSLISTQITNLVDFMPSPRYDQDTTIYLLTFGGKSSLWRTVNGGTGWERILCNSLPGFTTMDLIRISPEYGENGKTVIFITGTSGANPVLWKSENGGNRFLSPKTSYDPNSGAVFAINQCVPTGNESLIMGTFDGVNGLIYRTDNSGLSYTAKAAAGTKALYDIAVSPEYKEDNVILAGNSTGSIYYSVDGGLSFNPLPLDAAVAPLAGNVSVAFDTDFERNMAVYAASDTAGKGIFKFVTGRSTGWESIDSTMPAGSLFSSLIMSEQGTLYVSNSKAGNGIERSLDANLSQGAVFETVNRSLESTAKLNKIRVTGNLVWAIDTANNRLMSYPDALSAPVSQTSPDNKAGGVSVANVRLEWDTLEGATGYRWQIDNDNDFSTIPAGFQDDTQAASTLLPALQPNTTYYWRVRAITPVLSPWSARRSFTTFLSGEIAAPELTTPGAGVRVPSRPVLQWTAISGSENYELLIDTAYTFTNPVVKKIGVNALPTTAWQCEISLEPDTTYYWKVRAANGSSSSAWSNTGVFITESSPLAKSAPVTENTAAKPVPQSPVPATTQGIQTVIPAPPTSVITAAAPVTTIIQIQQDMPEWMNWAFYLGGALAVILVGLLITMVVFVVKVNRYD